MHRRIAAGVAVVAAIGGIGLGLHEARPSGNAESDPMIFVPEEPITPEQQQQIDRRNSVEERRFKVSVRKAEVRIQDDLDNFKGKSSKIDYLAFLACKNTPTPQLDTRGVSEPEVQKGIDGAVRNAAYNVYAKEPIFNAAPEYEQQPLIEIVQNACPQKFPPEPENLGLHRGA